MPDPPLTVAEQMVPPDKLGQTRNPLDKYFTVVTVKAMTLTLDDGNFRDDFIDARTKQRAAARAEFDAMSDAMVQEQGLLNHVQAALLLDVSPKRIGELVRLGKFTRFDFMGRTYISARELRERRDADVQAGRPKRNLLQRVVVSLNAAAKTDAAQVKLGSFAGPYEKAKHKNKKK